MENCKLTSYPVICIPRITSDITRFQIYSVFEKLKWGIVDNITIIGSNKKTNSKIKSNCVFININWFSSDEITDIREKLNNGISLKLVYNDFTFWKLYAKK